MPNRKHLIFQTLMLRKNNSMIKDEAVMKYLQKLEFIVVRALIVMMALVVLFASLDLAWIIIRDLSTPPYLLFDVNRLLEIFGMFLLVLIGIELLESIRMYLDHKLVHVEVVMTVAIIAIARKVIILDVKELDGLKLIGIGVIIIALAGGYIFIKRCYRDGTICVPERRAE
jgi:uncharacterized membrane protein (DUF373 family)